MVGAKSGMFLKGKCVAFLSPFLYPSFWNIVKVVSYLGTRNKVDLGRRVEQ